MSEDEEVVVIEPNNNAPVAIDIDEENDERTTQMINQQQPKSIATKSSKIKVKVEQRPPGPGGLQKAAIPTIPRKKDPLTSEEILMEQSEPGKRGGK